MNDFAILAPLFVIVCPAALFVCIIALGDAAGGSAVFLVALAAVLRYMDTHTDINMRGDNDAA
jgi:hypothetical protein